MEIATGARLSMAMQMLEVRHRVALEMVKQQQQQSQAVVEMIAAAASGRGETLDLLV